MITPTVTLTNVKFSIGDVLEMNDGSVAVIVGAPGGLYELLLLKAMDQTLFFQEEVGKISCWTKDGFSRHVYSVTSRAKS